jgi:hypothetical protein
MQRWSFRFTRNSVAWLCATLFFAGCVRATAGQEPVLQQQSFVFALMLCCCSRSRAWPWRWW